MQKSRLLKHLTALALVSMAFTTQSAQAQDVSAAWKLYTDKQYVASADAFERLVASSKPDARLYYYAALANMGARRTLRAKQFFEYVVSSFPGAPEAALSRTAAASLGRNDTPKQTAAASAAPAAASTTAAGVASAVTTGAAASMATSGTQAAVAGTAATASSASVKSAAMATKPGTTGAIATVEPTQVVKPHKKGDFAFTPEDIAREGANGIDQTNAPNCWFESAMSALAQLPRGQKLLARMITYGDGDSYMVRFPGDGREYKVTDKDLEMSGVKCTAKWASLLDYAQRLKFPNNIGASGPDGDMHRLQVGLSCITGCRADMLIPSQASTQEISSFIYGATTSQNPITCGTSMRTGRTWVPVFENHAYTIVGFDSSRNMIIIRNPHGHKSHVFELRSDPQHLKFENIGDGVFKMNIELFKEAFGSICRSFI